jgi:hypothetical protein
MLHSYVNSHSSSTPLISYNKEQQTSRSNNQLYRYNHEPVSSNLLRRDIPPILILLFFLFLIVITLSQILVVHTSRYGANFSTMQKIQEELRLMDDSMESLLRDNVLPIDKWRLLFHIQTYLYRFEYLFDLFNNETDIIITNQTITNINIKKLLNKSNEFLLRENTSYHLMNNIKHVQNRLKAMINENQDFQLQQRRIKNNSKRKRNYCREEPRYLRKF